MAVELRMKMSPLQAGKLYMAYEKKKEENKELREALVSVKTFIENADQTACMCGDSMSKHTVYDNHMPLSMYDYTAPKMIAEIEQVLKETK